jgi:hypothetical protein
MARTLPKSVTESKPVQAVAGAGDLAVEKLKEVSKAAQERFAAMEADPTAVSNRVQLNLEESAGKLGSALRGASEDVRLQWSQLSEKAQKALHEALEQAGHTYDALADRGKDVVIRLSGDSHELEGPAPTTAPPTDKPAAKSAAKKQAAPHASAAGTPKPTTTRKTSRTTAKKGS